MAKLLTCLALLILNVCNPTLADEPNLEEATIEASNKALEFFAQNVDENGQLVADQAEVDVCYYYKLPLALYSGGYYNEANKVLDFIKENFIREDGDVRTSDDIKTCSFALNEYYPYTNGWILMAAQRMGRFDISYPLYEYLKGYIPGFPTQGPSDEGNTMTDIFTSAHFGMISLFMNDLKYAKKAAKTILKILRKQPDWDEGLYLRIDKGKIVTEYDPGLAPFYLVNKTAPFQLHFMEGYPTFFLIRLYEATGDECYLDAAREIIDWAVQCDESMWQFFYTHKLGMAMSHMARITGDPTMKFNSERIITLLLSLQNDDGTFLDKDLDAPADIYDQSAEIALWLRVMDSNLY